MHVSLQGSYASLEHVYTDDQLEGHRVLREDVVLIEKPFTAERLATQLHAVLVESGAVRPLAAIS